MGIDIDSRGGYGFVLTEEEVGQAFLRSTTPFTSPYYYYASREELLQAEGAGEALRSLAQEVDLHPLTMGNAISGDFTYALVAIPFPSLERGGPTPLSEALLQEATSRLREALESLGLPRDTSLGVLHGVYLD